jgi:hypothetical protein
VDPEPGDAHGEESEAAVGQLGGLGNLGHRPSPESDIAATHLTTSLDQHHPESPVSGEALSRQGPVAKLEDVQR